MIYHIIMDGVGGAVRFLVVGTIGKEHHFEWFFI